MIKCIIILINMLALLVMRVFFAADVNVKIDAPSQVKQGEEFTVSLTINKGSIAGIGHMIETLPAGFGNAMVVEAKGSEFKYLPQGNVVKFIWISLPADEAFTVSYKVKVNADAPTGNVTLAGKFSYVIDNQKQTFIVPKISIAVIGETLATTTEPETTATTTTEPETTNSTTIQPKTTIITTTEPETIATTTTTTETSKTSANLGIVFKVQIGAFNEMLSIATTNRFLRIAKQSFKTYKNERGLTIYTVGEYLEYEFANNLKTRLISNGLSDAFVTAFKNGKRMSTSVARELIKNK